MGTLTVADPDADVHGRARDFEQAVRKRWGLQLYFQWAELQLRGVVHYHFAMVDGPGPRAGFTQEWVRETWGLGHVSLNWHPAHRTKTNVLGDVVAYVKKMGWKEYQHAYELLPKGLRAFSSTRLKTPYARLAMQAPLLAQAVEYAGLVLREAAKRVKGGLWTFVASRLGSRAPPKRVDARVMVSVDRSLMQATLWGVTLTQAPLPLGL